MLSLFIYLNCFAFSFFFPSAGQMSDLLNAMFAKLHIKYAMSEML